MANYRNFSNFNNKNENIDFLISYPCFYQFRNNLTNIDFFIFLAVIAALHRPSGAPDVPKNEINDENLSKVAGLVKSKFLL